MTDETVDGETNTPAQAEEESLQNPVLRNPLRSTVTLDPAILVAVSDALTAHGKPLSRAEASIYVNRVLASHFAWQKRELTLAHRLDGTTSLTEAGQQVKVHSVTLPSHETTERAFVESVLKREETQAELLEAGIALYRSEYPGKTGVLTFALREYTRPGSRRAERSVVLRRLRPGGSHAPLRPEDSLMLPPSALPWLQKSLAAAELESKTIAHRRRQQTAEESGIADPEGRAAYQRQRAEYVDRYGPERVVRAVEKASRHRERARVEYGLSNHFTAFEWLDLMGSFRFRCALCGEGEETQLEPHHGRELSRGGSNEIGNLYPLCPDCHYRIHYHQIAFGRGWWEQQMLLCQQFSLGSRVVSSHPNTRAPWWSVSRYEVSDDTGNIQGLVGRAVAPEAEILAIFPAERLPGSLWEKTDRSRRMNSSAFGIVLESPPEEPDMDNKGLFGATLWKAARAQVRWRVAPGHCSSEERTAEVPLDHLEPCVPTTWIAQQQALSDRFSAGDMVRRAGDFDGTTRLKTRSVPGVILRLISPEAGQGMGVAWQEARAEVRFPASGSTTDSVVSVCDLRRLDKGAWLAEQQALWQNGPRVGDIVRQVGRPHNRQGEVLRAGGPEWSDLAPLEGTVPWCPAWAVVRWRERNGTVHEEEVQDLAVLVSEQKKR